MKQEMPSGLFLKQGVCHALFAYDIGLSINLEEADRRILSNKARGSFQHRSRAPQYLEYRPAPLRVMQDTEPFPLGTYVTQPQVEVILYDFGAVSVSYRIIVEGSLSALLLLSDTLRDNRQLVADSRTRIEQLVSAIRPAIERPAIAREVEDYLIFEIEEYVAQQGPDISTSHDELFARILRCEQGALSDQEVREATSSRISYGPDDAAIIDWNAALLFGSQMEDVRAVLEFANVELLEMRILDEQLTRALDQAYTALSMRPGLWAHIRLPGFFEADSRRIAQLQVDGAILFERVTNTLKLVGDQYLARVYRLVSQRLHLESWDASIVRKLHTLDSIYGKMTDRSATRRMEMLEWIIILLIALSIALSFH